MLSCMTCCPSYRLARCLRIFHPYYTPVSSNSLPTLLRLSSARTDLLAMQVGDYGLHNTPSGMKQIIDAAVKVCPALADLAIERTWAGLRPVTPDTFPVLGASHRCPNLFVAGGYWRNGVLLAPKTAQLVADSVCGCLSSEDKYYLQEFSMDRFSSSGTPAATAAAAQAPPAARASLGTGMGTRGFVSEASPSEVLEMERAALEGVNDGDMLSTLEGMFGKGMVHVEVLHIQYRSRYTLSHLRPTALYLVTLLMSWWCHQRVNIVWETGHAG